MHKMQSATRIEESNTQGYSTKHFDFNAAVGQAKDLLAREENASPDLDKAMGSYLEDEFPWAVKSGCALLESITSWELAQRVLQRRHGERAASSGFSHTLPVGVPGKQN